MKTTPDNTLIDAEQRYLGACLFDAKAYWSAGPVRPDDFVSLRHAQLFEAVQAVMRGEGEAPPILVARGACQRRPVTRSTPTCWNSWTQRPRGRRPCTTRTSCG